MNDEKPDDEMTETAPPGKDNAAPEECELQANDTKPLKWLTTLEHTLAGRCHRFDAERFGDHALHSTVSAINRKHGIVFSREWVEVPTRFNKPCRVMRYWVSDLSREQAMRLVDRYRRKKRGGKV